MIYCVWCREEAKPGLGECTQNDYHQFTMTEMERGHTFTFTKPGPKFPEEQTEA